MKPAAPLNIATSYSTISGADLLDKVVSQYPISSPQSCGLWQRGVNDTYKLCCENKNYSLRVYRHQWRTREEIDFEIEALNYLAEHGVPVASPVAKKDGSYLTEVAAAEGARYVLITEYAEGQTLRYSDEEKGPENARLYGQSSAQLHLVSDKFTTQLSRPHTELAYLLERSLDIVCPHLQHRPEDLEFIEQIAIEAREKTAAAETAGLDRGFCHGDFHGGNAHQHNNELTYYDFDCCGTGLRAFDLATFCWSMRLHGVGEKGWEPFLEGYRSVRSISETDLELVETYVKVRHVWLMALHMGNADDFGHGVRSDDYIDHQLESLRKRLSKETPDENKKN